MAVIKRAQAITQSSRVETVYSDFTTSFDIHPTKLDLVTTTNDEAVKRSIRNLLLTDRGERLFNPILGSDIRSLLFENFSPQTESSLRDYIETTINNYEPRANLIDVIVSALLEANAYSVTVVFSVINKSEPIVLDILLNRIR
jgi:phage baseplate assembly protein W